MTGHCFEKYWRVVALVAILIGAAAIRLCFMGVCLTNDETITYDWASGSLSGALRSQNYPLANVLAWLALQASDAEYVMRLPALVAGLLSIAALYVLGKKTFGAPAGLLAATLLAVSTFHIQHSHNARYYSYVMLAAILSMLALERYTSTGRARWLPVWAAAMGLGAIAHPFWLMGAATLCVGGGVWHLLSRSLTGIRKRLLLLVLFAAFTAVGLAPVLVYAVPRLLILAGIGISPAQAVSASGASAYTHTLEFKQYVGILRQLAGGLAGAGWPVLALLGLLGLLSLFRRNLALAVGVALAFAAPAPLFFVRVTHWYAIQYFSYLLPMMALVAAGGLWMSARAISAAAAWALRKLRRGNEAGSRWGWVREPLTVGVVMSLIVACAVPGIGRYYRDTPQDDWKRIANYLVGRIDTGDALFLAAAYYNAKDKTKSNYQGRPLLHYLERFQPGDTLVKYEIYNGVTPQRLYAALEACPNRTVWIPAISPLLTDEMRALLPKLCGPPLLEGRPALYVLGEPTVNQVAWGGFEGDPVGVQMGPGIEVVEGPEAFSGRSLRIINTNPKQSLIAWMPIAMDETGAPATELKDGEIYTLSLYMRFEDAAPPDANIRLCVMGLYGNQPDDMKLWKELTFAQGTRGWRHYVYRVVPGETYMAGTRKMSVFVGFFHGVGTLWVDNVQLEHKAHPTPFVQGVRLPRSETIEALKKKP